MKKSYAFEAVLVILLIGLIGLLCFAIASTPHTENAWEKKANSSVGYMFVGSDDTLYTFSGNDIAAFAKSGNLLWQLNVSSDWKILNNWVMPEYGVGDGYTSTVFGSYPIVGENDGSLYLFEMSALNETDIKVIGSNTTEKLAGNNTVYSIPEVPYITKPAKIVKISPDGNIEWAYSFVTNLSTWDIQGLAKPYDHDMKKPIAVSVHGDRIYVFHDYTEDVVDTGGKLLFSIDNVAAPAAVDDLGQIYIVHAEKPTMEQFNQSIERTYATNGSISNYDAMMISEDVTYMLTSSTVEAYSRDGSLLWGRDIGANVTITFMDEQVWPYYNTLPLCSNGQLYAPVKNGIVQIRSDGTVNWTTYVKDGGYMLFPMMPLDSSGNVYMTNTGQSPAQASLITISPEGRVSNDIWPYAEYDDVNYNQGLVPVGSNDGIVYAYESTGYSLYYMPESDFNETLVSRRFSADTIVAYEVAKGKELWNFTIPINDVHLITLDENNEAKALLWHQPVYTPIVASAVTTRPDKEGDIRVYTGRNVTYVNYYYSIFDTPMVYNQSRCIYARSIYALDNNGSLLWSKDVNGFVDKMAAGNSTIYYSLDNGRIGGSGANVVAGIAVAAIVYMFLRFFMLGAVTRARDRLDENRNRRCLFRYIVDHPGVTAADMAKDLGINMGTIRYHLFILSLNHKVIIHRDDTKFLRYFKNSGAYTDSEKDLVSMIRRKPLQKIIHVLIEKQKLSGPDLAKELNISDTAVYRHIAELQENDIIEKFPGNDRNSVYSIKGERLDQIKQLMSRF